MSSHTGVVPARSGEASRSTRSSPGPQAHSEALAPDPNPHFYSHLLP